MRLVFCVLTVGWAAALVVPAARSPARPALRLGGEWAGHSVTYGGCGAAAGVGAEVLTSESWQGVGTDSAIVRRTAQLGAAVPAAAAVPAVASVLPPACSGSISLRLGAAMLEPEVMNVRAWSLDSEEDGLFRCETVFDGLGGVEPIARDGALECPMTRTRVQCTFDPSTGALAPSSSVLVWQERCWSAAPSADLDGAEVVDGAWASSAVGIERFGAPAGGAAGGTAGGAAGGALALSLGGGVSVRGSPERLEVEVALGENESNPRWWPQRVIMRRTWAGGAAGRSKFAEVEEVGSRVDATFE